jgi:Fe-Mn family superoxide dismutase
MHVIPSSAMKRRSALKTIGAGAAFIAFAPIGSMARASQRELVAPALGANIQPFTLPPMAFAYDALEPHFDARTMEIHHAKHHQAYINAANKALEARPDLRELSGEQLIGRLDAFEEPFRSTLRNQLGGHLNHSFFWRLLAPSADYRPGPLSAALNRRFGSMEEFKKQFEKAALSRFGSGWAWLVWQDGELSILSTANQDSPLMSGAEPIIGLDVWEHAYYLSYQNRRADYVQAFWRVLNWDAAEQAYGCVAPV